MYRNPAASVCIVLVLVVGYCQAASPRKYKVGAASVVITPKVAPDADPVWLAGYGMGRRAIEVHDDIYARAMVVHDGKFGVAIVSCDLVGLFYDQVEMIRKEVAELGLEPKLDYVLVSSTHTHAGPDTIGIWGPLGRTGLTKGFLRKVRDSCVQAIKESHEKMRTVTLRIATVDVNERVRLIRDSRQPTVIDSIMTVIQAKQAGGKVVATLINVPNHPEVLGSKNPKLSSDYPSTTREYIESKFGGVCVYNSGTVGGLLAPSVPKTDPFTRKPMPRDEHKRMMAYGRIMGRIAERALKRTERLSGPVSAKTETVFLPVWNHIYKVAMGMGLFNRQVYDGEFQPVTISRQTATGTRKAVKIKDPHLKTEVGLIRIGQLGIAAIPGEIYPEITVGEYQQPQDQGADFKGARHEPPIYPLMKSKYKMVIGLANDEVGYIIPKCQWDWYHPYAYGRKERQYGEVNACGPDVAPMLMAAWKKLVKRGR